MKQKYAILLIGVLLFICADSENQKHTIQGNDSLYILQTAINAPITDSLFAAYKDTVFNIIRNPSAIDYPIIWHGKKATYLEDNPTNNTIDLGDIEKHMNPKTDPSEVIRLPKMVMRYQLTFPSHGNALLMLLFKNQGIAIEHALSYENNQWKIKSYTWSKL